MTNTAIHILLDYGESQYISSSCSQLSQGMCHTPAAPHAGFCRAGLPCTHKEQEDTPEDLPWLLIPVGEI